MGTRLRQIYQTDVVYVSPTGTNAATGKAYSNSVFRGIPAASGFTGISLDGANLTSQLFRVQRVGWNASKNLTDVNQFGELAAIDRIPLNPPTVTLTIDYLLANLINESLMGFQISNAGGTQVSMISGLLAATTSPKNFYVKTVSEGADGDNNSNTTYNVIAFGNGFISSYTSQAAVGGFPTATVSIDCLNMQVDAFGGITSGNIIPAVNPSDGTYITGFYYNLPTGLTSYGGAGLTSSQGLSALRPGQISLNLGLDSVGDTFFDPNDIKVQSYNLSFNLNQEDLNKLGSKFAFAKVPRFPVTYNLTVNALAGDFVTGKLTEFVNNNDSYNPTITIVSPIDNSTVIVKYSVNGAKLDTHASDLNIGANKTYTMTFVGQIGGPNQTVGVKAEGVTVNPAG